LLEVIAWKPEPTALDAARELTRFTLASSGVAAGFGCGHPPYEPRAEVVEPVAESVEHYWTLPVILLSAAFTVSLMPSLTMARISSSEK
jgi:hypothetical protein